MRISYASILLAHGNPALGLAGPSGLSQNGRQLVDEADFFRAATATFYGRGARSVAFAFAVLRTFDSAAEAEAFALLHHNDLPDEGELRVTCDGGGLDGKTVTLAAVLEAVDLEGVSGASVRLRYAYRGSAWASDESPVPEPDLTMTRRANIAIDSGATSVAVVFASALSGVPFVQCTVLMPTAGGDAIFATVREDTISATGFTADLSGPTPGAGYKLSYRAEL